MTTKPLLNSNNDSDIPFLYAFHLDANVVTYEFSSKLRGLGHLCFQVSFGSDFSCALAGNPLPYVRWAVAKLDALCLANAKEPDRLHIHQRCFGHLQHNRAAAGPGLGPQFGEIFSTEPADQLDNGAVFVWYRFHFECHTEAGKQRTRQSKLSNRRELARTGVAVFSACRTIGTRWRVNYRLLYARRSSPRRLNRDEPVN